jgi:hypothetical protein
MSTSNVLNGNLLVRQATSGQTIVGIIDAAGNVINALGHRPTTNVAANATIDAGHRDHVIVVDSSQAPVTISIDASDVLLNQMFVSVQRRGGNAVTISVQNGSVNGGTNSYVLDTDMSDVDLVVNTTGMDVTAMAGGAVGVQSVDVEQGDGITVSQSGNSHNPVFNVSLRRENDLLNLLKLLPNGDASVKLLLGSGLEWDTTDASGTPRLRMNNVALDRSFTFLTPAARDAAVVAGTLEAGDFAIVADTGSGQPGSFQLQDDGAWVQFQFGNLVQSVAGKTGVIELMTKDLTDWSTADPLTGQIPMFDGAKYVPTYWRRVFENVAVVPGTPQELVHGLGSRHVRMSAYNRATGRKEEIASWFDAGNSPDSKLLIDGNAPIAYDVVVGL